MNNPIRRLLILCVVALAAASCQTVPAPAPMPQLTFSHLTPIRLAVGAIDVTSVYVPPLRAPNIEHTVPVSPDSALRLWVARRLEAGGGEATARLVIETASVTSTALAKTAGIKGAFIKDQSERFEVVVKAELRIYQGGASSAGFAVAEASHSRTIAEDASVNDRTRIQFELIEAVMAEFDREMEKTMRTHLARWLK